MIDVAAEWSRSFISCQNRLNAFGARIRRSNCGSTMQPGPEGLALLRTGRVDFGVGPLPDAPDDVEFHPIATYDPVLITSLDHPLAKLRTMSLQEISKYPLILPPRHLSTSTW